MKTEVLVSCMHQENKGLLSKSRITGDAVVINQCSREGRRIVPTERGNALWIDSAQRGLTRSRNMAIAASSGDVCVLCDDDEVFAPDYLQTIRSAYEEIPEADVIIFKVGGWDAPFPKRVRRLRVSDFFHVGSWQITFRRERLVETGLRFDELLGAGTGNGAEEELKFLLDCRRAGLNVYGVPREIAQVQHNASTWFTGFDEPFFCNRGASTRYILGYLPAVAYGLYYVLRKRPQYRTSISSRRALKALLRGVHENKIRKQKTYESIITDRSGL